MVPYLGDFSEDQSVFVAFNTFDSNDPSASVTITNLADTDIHIHKNDGTTQHASATDVDVQINFDTITGNHMIEIRTTDVFFTTGADYFVRMEGTTVDAATVNAWIAHFSIENRFTNVTKVSGTSQTANDNGLDINTLITQIGTAGAGLTDLGGMSTGMKVEVNAEAKDVIATDTIAELGVGAPSATPTLENAIMLLYMALRNTVNVKTSYTTDAMELTNNAGTVICHKDITDDGSDYAEAEMQSGAST